MFTHTSPALFNQAECKEIIRLSEASGLEQGGLVGGQLHDNIRRAKINWLNDQGDGAWVMQRVVQGVAEANREVFQFDLTDFKERLQVACYDESDEGHYDWHSDIGDGPLARHRKLTIVSQLSSGTQYEGGSLEISLGGHARESDRQIGTATIFASFMLHRVMPVTKGRRYSLTCWCHGPQFR